MSKKVKSAVAKMPGVWREVWSALNDKYTVNLSEYNTLSIVNPPKINTSYNVTDFWSLSTGSAKKKGWDWWGDTTIWVTEIKGPKTFEEVRGQLL